jgi:tRNA pseudouridine13 synthase
MNIKEKPEDFIVEEVIDLDLKPGDYTYIKLVKRNRNTLDAIREIADKLRIPRKCVSFAGTKDKIAVTTQYLSLHKVSQERVENLKLLDAEVEFIGTGTRPINLGTLKGNKFKIKIDFPPKKVEKIINYFGPQRFSTNNVAIGKLILKQEFKKAVELIDRREPFEHLQEHKNDYLGALQSLDRKLLSLFLSAYQSYLWNIVVKDFTNKSTLSLYSFDAELSEELEEAYEKLLKKEGLEPKDFILRKLPDVSPLSSTRLVRAEVKGFNFEKPWVSFFLPKGSYATVALEQMQ